MKNKSYLPKNSKFPSSIEIFKDRLSKYKDTKKLFSEFNTFNFSSRANNFCVFCEPGCRSGNR